MILISFAFFFIQSASAQLPNIPAERAQLSALSPKPNPQNSVLDKVQYPNNFNDAFIQQKVKSPTPYLQWKAGDFQVTDFPSNSSDQTQGELQYLAKLQKSVSPEITKTVLQINRFEEPNIKYTQNDVNGSFFVTQFLQDRIQRSQMPLTKKLLNNSLHNIVNFCFRLKYVFNRARPHQLDSQIKSLLSQGAVPPHPAYPSAHSCVGYGSAEIFSLLAPKFKAEFLKHADEIAFSRELAGIHYPSDNHAAQEIVQKMLQRFQAVPSFQMDLKAAQNEWLKIFN